jgi:GNAT superfamily N-acetyltransferase
LTTRVYACEPLDDRHDLSRFDSGKPDLDRWLREHARGAAARRTGRTFVSLDADSSVIAYYTIAAHLLERADLPLSIGRGSPDRIPAVLLARLALDRTLHGQGHGGMLLADALARIVAATEVVAARFVVVDAIDERAASFYEHHGFRRIPDSDRLIQKVSDIAAALNRA